MPEFFVGILLGIVVGAAGMWRALTAGEDPWRDVNKRETRLQKFQDAGIGVKKKES